MDAKAEGAEAAPHQEAPSASLDMEHFDPNSDNVIETVDEIGGVDLSTGGARPTEKAEPAPKEEPPKEDASVKEESEAKKDEAVAQEPYHKDPAWQRIIKERDDAVIKLDTLSRRVEALETTKSVVDPNLPDISNMTDEEILELQNDDPKAYVSALRQAIMQDAKAEVLAELEQRNGEAKVDKTFDEYANQNPDNKDGTGFVQMWDSGATKQFMDANPGHNAISAHMALTAEAKTQAKIDAAVKKAKAEMTKQIQARVVTDGLGAGPAHTPTETNELNDTNKKGGRITVLADRLRKMRQAI
jgi:hypothetical protein